MYYQIPKLLGKGICKHRVSRNYRVVLEYSGNYRRKSKCLLFKKVLQNHTVQVFIFLFIIFRILSNYNNGGGRL